jgi:alpha-soluble NSF attachment protein
MASGDSVMVANRLEVAKNEDFSFNGSRECTMLEKLKEATDNNDAEAFATACADFDRITPLDPWKMSLLLKSKGFIIGEGGAGGDEDDVDLS